MMTEEKDDPWITWLLKAIVVLFLTILPVSGILFLFMLVPWIPADWSGSTFLLSGLVILVGSVYLLSTSDLRVWIYSIAIGYMIGIGSMGLFLVQGLTQIPVPVFGNAFYAAAAVVTGLPYRLHSGRSKHLLRWP